MGLNKIYYYKLILPAYLYIFNVTTRLLEICLSHIVFYGQWWYSDYLTLISSNGSNQIWLFLWYVCILYVHS